MTELTRRVGDLEVPQDLRFERTAYRVRQVVAVLFALVLVAGLLGVLGGSGPLSATSASAGGNLGVDFERFARLETPTDLHVRTGAGEGPTNVALSRAYLDGFRLTGFSVGPDDTTVLADRVVFTFDQRAPAEVTFYLEPQRIGTRRGTVHGPDGSELSIAQWVWP